MFGVDNISLILLLVIGGISVYYIFSDGLGKKQDSAEKVEDKPTVPDVKEEVKEEPKVQQVETKQTATNTKVNTDTIQQTEDYNPTVSAPLPKMPKAAVQDSPTEEQPVHMEAPSEVKSELTMEDLKGSNELIKVQCQWCDFVVEMRKGETMVCPRCSGTIES